MRWLSTSAGVVLCLTLLAPACGDAPDSREEALGGNIDFDPNRPDPTDNSGGDVPTYDGSNPYVLEAQEKFRTPLDLHRKVIQRTCSPTGGVCHNRKEYPDMHTPANFLSTVGAACNLQPGERSSVYDRCERPGDRFAFKDEDFNEIEIGYIERIKGEHDEYDREDNPPEVDSPGLHIYLHTAVPLERTVLWDTGQFIRSFVDDSGKVQDLAYARFRTRWWILEDGRHLMAEVSDYQADKVSELMSVGIVQGDLNQNGEYGARQSEPVSLLEPGRPEESYLIARLRGQMQGESVPGTRMPLANQPLSIPEMLALFCFVEGLPTDETATQTTTPSGERPINYEACSYSDDPEALNLLGEGVTWTGRVSKILEANCGGCHGGQSPSAGFDVLSEDAYDNVLAASTQMPDIKRVEPGNPEESYLWWKINAYRDTGYADMIQGEPMPINPIDGMSTLGDPEFQDIKTWIENGALQQ
jgi:hypothetical protein